MQGKTYHNQYCCFGRKTIYNVWDRREDVTTCKTGDVALNVKELRVGSSLLRRKSSDCMNPTTNSHIKCPLLPGPRRFPGPAGALGNE